MAKKMNSEDLKAKEDAMPEAEQPAKEKVDFDVWHAMRKDRIAKHHRKEILKADFKARGVSQSESLEDFDAALKKYGVKLA